MKKLKLNQIVSSVEALRELAAVKFPIKISYQLSRLMIEIDRELKIYEEKRVALIKEFGVEDKESGNFKIDVEDKEATQKFYDEFEKLMGLEVEVQFADKINMADLGDIAIEPKYLVDWLFD